MFNRGGATPFSGSKPGGSGFASLGSTIKRKRNVNVGNSGNTPSSVTSKEYNQSGLGGVMGSPVPSLSISNVKLKYNSALRKELHKVNLDDHENGPLQSAILLNNGDLVVLNDRGVYLYESILESYHPKIITIGQQRCSVGNRMMMMTEDNDDIHTYLSVDIYNTVHCKETLVSDESGKMTLTVIDTDGGVECNSYQMKLEMVNNDVSNTNNDDSSNNNNNNNNSNLGSIDEMSNDTYPASAEGSSKNNNKNNSRNSDDKVTAIRHLSSQISVVGTLNQEVYLIRHYNGGKVFKCKRVQRTSPMFQGLFGTLVTSIFGLGGSQMNLSEVTDSSANTVNNKRNERSESITTDDFEMEVERKSASKMFARGNLLNGGRAVWLSKRSDIESGTFKILPAQGGGDRLLFIGSQLKLWSGCLSDGKEELAWSYDLHAHIAGYLRRCNDENVNTMIEDKRNRFVGLVDASFVPIDGGNRNASLLILVLSAHDAGDSTTTGYSKLGRLYLIHLSLDVSLASNENGSNDKKVDIVNHICVCDNVDVEKSHQSYQPLLHNLQSYSDNEAALLKAVGISQQIPVDSDNSSRINSGFLVVSWLGTNSTRSDQGNVSPSATLHLAQIDLESFLLINKSVISSKKSLVTTTDSSIEHGEVITAAYVNGVDGLVVLKRNGSFESVVPAGKNTLGRISVKRPQQQQGTHSTDAQLFSSSKNKDSSSLDASLINITRRDGQLGSEKDLTDAKRVLLSICGVSSKTVASFAGYNEVIKVQKALLNIDQSQLPSLIEVVSDTILNRAPTGSHWDITDDGASYQLVRQLMEDKKNSFFILLRLLMEVGALQEPSICEMIERKKQLLMAAYGFSECIHNTQRHIVQITSSSFSLSLRDKCGGVVLEVIDVGMRHALSLRQEKYKSSSMDYDARGLSVADAFFTDISRFDEGLLVMLTSIRDNLERYHLQTMDGNSSDVTRMFQEAFGSLSLVLTAINYSKDGGVGRTSYSSNQTSFLDFNTQEVSFLRREHIRDVVAIILQSLDYSVSVLQRLNTVQSIANNSNNGDKNILQIWREEVIDHQNGTSSTMKHDLLAFCHAILDSYITEASLDDGRKDATGSMIIDDREEPKFGRFMSNAWKVQFGKMKRCVSRILLTLDSPFSSFDFAAKTLDFEGLLSATESNIEELMPKLVELNQRQGASYGTESLCLTDYCLQYYVKDVEESATTDDSSPENVQHGVMQRRIGHLFDIGSKQQHILQQFLQKRPHLDWLYRLRLELKDYHNAAASAYIHATSVSTENIQNSRTIASVAKLSSVIAITNEATSSTAPTNIDVKDTYDATKWYLKYLRTKENLIKETNGLQFANTSMNPVPLVEHALVYIENMLKEDDTNAMEETLLSAESVFGYSLQVLNCVLVLSGRNSSSGINDDNTEIEYIKLLIQDVWERVITSQMDLWTELANTHKESNVLGEEFEMRLKGTLFYRLHSFYKKAIYSGTAMILLRLDDIMEHLGLTKSHLSFILHATENLN